MNNVINNPAPQYTADEQTTIEFYLVRGAGVVVDFMGEADFTEDMDEDDPTTILTAQQINWLIKEALFFCDNTEYKTGSDRWYNEVDSGWYFDIKNDFIHEFDLNKTSWEYQDKLDTQRFEELRERVAGMLDPEVDENHPNIQEAIWSAANDLMDENPDGFVWDWKVEREARIIDEYWHRDLADDES